MSSGAVTLSRCGPHEGGRNPSGLMLNTFSFVPDRAIIVSRLNHQDSIGKLLLYTRLQRYLPLIAVVVLAVALTAVMSNAAMARSTFQSSPLEPVATPTATPPEVAATETPTAEIFEPTPEPIVPMATEPPVAPVQPPGEPGQPPAGFLPAPTLTNPDALRPLPSVAQPPLSGPTVSPAEPAPPEPAAASSVPTVAQLIDNGIIALSYVWLCCGMLVLISGALVLVWLARRSARR